jgi:hypothetical protein
MAKWPTPGVRKSIEGAFTGSKMKKTNGLTLFDMISQFSRRVAGGLLTELAISQRQTTDVTHNITIPPPNPTSV